MARELFPGRSDQEPANDAQARLADRWKAEGVIDIAGMSDAQREQFAREREQRLSDEIQLIRQAFGFRKEERAWFATGEDQEQLALQQLWETTGSLDMGNLDEETRDTSIRDETKLRFAKEKKSQLQEAIRAGHLPKSEAVMEKLRRLDLLIEQYGKAVD